MHFRKKERETAFLSFFRGSRRQEGSAVVSFHLSSFSSSFPLPFLPVPYYSILRTYCTVGGTANKRKQQAAGWARRKRREGKEREGASEMWKGSELVHSTRLFPPSPSLESACFFMLTFYCAGNIFVVGRHLNTRLIACTSFHLFFLPHRPQEEELLGRFSLLAASASLMEGGGGGEGDERKRGRREGKEKGGRRVGGKEARRKRLLSVIPRLVVRKEDEDTYYLLYYYTLRPEEEEFGDVPKSADVGYWPCNGSATQIATHPPLLLLDNTRWKALITSSATDCGGYVHGGHVTGGRDFNSWVSFKVMELYILPMLHVLYIRQSVVTVHRFFYFLAFCKKKSKSIFDDLKNTTPVVWLRI